ncbi:hypothetical protein [Sphingomonas hengshuiensis]|uniref:Transcriptional regulator n=1 Tax=Sphingomonas hengshuiensis TaxID=1609977 RepID=A0A7U4J671_9SPHN|nr:hypothetical protein [Sphingomonas hengshuiensis]AJP70982.1 hypothetical protein TS85_02795 [Sphingomonas hengshuiensis]
MSVQWKIEKFLRASEMSATRFGRLAAGDPRLVKDLRRGREPRPALVARIEAFLDAQDDSL